jgi:predicted nucleic acid-binding protein
VKFWDASAVVSLLALEAPSWKTLELFRQDPEVVLWWGTSVECVSALARVEREGLVAEAARQRAWTVLESLRASAIEVRPDNNIRLSAEGLLSKHPLRAGDALQLAAALAWREGHPGLASFVTLDHRLGTAAALEGFWVVPYVDEVHETAAAYG